jgi:hypothetical protein
MAIRLERRHTDRAFSMPGTLAKGQRFSQMTPQAQPL